MMNEKFRACRYKAMMKKPYLSTAILAVKVIETDKIPTLCISEHWILYYNPDCLASMTLDEGSAAIQHEIWHVLRKHSDRFRHCDNMFKSLIATDLEINDDDGLQDLPKWCITPAGYGLRDHLLAEEYYDQLPDDAAEGTSVQNCGSGSSGIPQEWEGPGRSGGDETELDDGQPTIGEAKAEIIRQQVAEAAKKAGNTSQQEKLWAEEILRGTEPDWRTLLKRQVRNAKVIAAGMDDYTFTKINRRIESYRPFIMPSSISRVPSIGLGLDTSGSMLYDSSLKRALGSVESILNAAGNNLYIVCCDATAYKPQRIHTTKSIDLLGGGGTDMGQVIAACDKLPTNITVVLTDGETPWPRSKPKKPVVVGVVSRQNKSSYVMTSVPSWASKVLIPIDNLDK